MNPQIVFNINLAGEAAEGHPAAGVLNARAGGSLPTPMNALGAAGGVSDYLPTPMGIEVRSGLGRQQVPTPFEAATISGTSAGALPTPFDAMKVMRGAMAKGLPQPAMLGPMEASGGAAGGALPAPDDFDPSSSYQGDKQSDPRPGRGRK
jgi:hypothetical protein